MQASEIDKIFVSLKSNHMNCSDLQVMQLYNLTALKLTVTMAFIQIVFVCPLPTYLAYQFGFWPQLIGLVFFIAMKIVAAGEKNMLLRVEVEHKANRAMTLLLHLSTDACHNVLNLH